MVILVLLLVVGQTDYIGIVIGQTDYIGKYDKPGEGCWCCLGIASSCAVPVSPHPMSHWNIQLIQCLTETFKSIVSLKHPTKSIRYMPVSNFDWGSKCSHYLCFKWTFGNVVNTSEFSKKLILLSHIRRTFIALFFQFKSFPLKKL